jgi:hypothetical protein
MSSDPASNAPTDEDLLSLLLSAINRSDMPWPDGWGAAAVGPFLELVRRHGAGPLLWRSLHGSSRLESWPGSVRDALSEVAHRAAVAELLRKQAVGRVLAALDAGGIRALLLKGVPLAHTHYPESWLRPALDADLLVRPDDVGAAQRILDALGCARPPCAEGELILHQFSASLADAAGATHVFDVHWRVSNTNVFAEMLPYGELAAEAVPVPALGESAFTLSDRYALLLACIHRVGHHASSRRLIWLYDIHLLVEGMGEEAIRDFIDLARGKRAWRICADGIEHARTAFGTKWTSSLEEAVRDRDSFPDEPSALYLRPQRTQLGRLWLDLLTTRGVNRKMELLWRQAFPSAEYMLAKYRVHSRSLLPLLYLYRAVAGLRRLFGPPPH